MNVPVLETGRLVLRGYRLEDFQSHAAIWADPRTRRYFEGEYSEEDIWLRFLRNFGQWALFGYGYWGIEDKASGRFIGAVGFFQAKRPCDLPYRDQPETGWVIAPDFHGKGLAREAVAAAMAWGDRNIEAPQSWCMINPDNAPSRRVAEAAGYRPALSTEYKRRPVLTFVRPRGGPDA